MPGMDAVYNHVTPDMRRHLCDVLEDLWRTAVRQRRAFAPHSEVALVSQALAGCERADPEFEPTS
jgi:hypothetical protein